MPFSKECDAETLTRFKKTIAVLEQHALSLACSVETVRQGTLVQSNARIEALEEKARDLARFVETTRQQTLLQSDKKTEALEQKARDLADFVETVRNQTRLQSDIKIAALGQQARDLALSVETVRKETRLQSETEIAVLGQQARDLAFSVETMREETLLHSDTEIAALGQTARDLAVSAAIVREETLLRSETEIKGLKQQARNLAFSVENSRIETLIESDTEIRKLNAILEQRVRERTGQLEAANKDLEKALRENTHVLDQLRSAVVELARSNQELEQFAYVAAHDLQEPLRKVVGYTQLLSETYCGKLGTDADEFIGYAVDGAFRMQALIQDLLAYSRVSRTAMEFANTRCEDVFEIAMKNLHSGIKESGAVISHDPLPELIADSLQLGQLLQNLIGNAIKFRGDGPPRVHVRADQHPGEWLFSVRDEGIGMAPQFLERVFVIFQRLHSRSDYPGTGIGLAICRKVVERHGGRIWAESQLGQGSVFYFTIPIVQLPGQLASAA